MGAYPELLTQIPDVARAKVDGARFVPIHYLEFYYPSADARHAGEYSLSGRYVVLMDDVVTTGSTMLAALHHIKQFNPAHHVECLALAKTFSSYQERFSEDPPRSLLEQPWPKDGLRGLAGRYPTPPRDMGSFHGSPDDDLPF